MKESKCTNFCVTVNGKTEKIEGPVAWVYETEMSKKEIKKAAKKQKKEFDKIWIDGCKEMTCTNLFKFSPEWLYEFNHDHTGLLPGVPFIMNDQLFKLFNEFQELRQAQKTMKTKKHKVEIPEDYKFVTNEVCAKGDELRVSKVYHKKPIKKQLPKTWKEYCKSIKTDTYASLLLSKLNKELTALIKLIELRDVYNDGWVPDWADDIPKYTIEGYYSKISADTSLNYTAILSFKSKELRDKFLENFGDNLIEQAKPLL